MLIIDSSLLMAIAEKRGLSLDRLFEDTLYKFELATTSSVLNELKKMASSKGGKALKARAALSIAEKLRIVDSVTEDVDTDVIEVAAKLRGIVATCDLELRRKAMRRGVPTLFLRSRKRLMVNSPVGGYLP